MSLSQELLDTMPPARYFCASLYCYGGDNGKADPVHSGRLYYYKCPVFGHKGFFCVDCLQEMGVPVNDQMISLTEAIWDVNEEESWKER